MTEMPSDSLELQESPPEKLEAMQILDPQTKQKLEELLPDLNKILGALCNKNVKKGRPLLKAIEDLEMIIEGRPDAVNLPIILISLATILQTAQTSFNGHESTFAHLCNSLIKKIEAIQAD